MEERNTLIGIGALLLAVGAGYGIGMASVCALASPGGRAHVDPSLRAAEVAKLQELIAGLEGDLSQQRQRRAALEQQLYGPPIAWPEEVEPRFSPEEFEAHVRQAVADCAPQVGVVAVECDEPPCVAWIRGANTPWLDAVTRDCAAWTEVYGPEVTVYKAGHQCPRHVEEMALLAPPPVALLGDDAAVREAWSRRWDLRVRRARHDWVCRE